MEKEKSRELFVTKIYSALTLELSDTTPTVCYKKFSINHESNKVINFLKSHQLRLNDVNYI